MKNRGKTRKSMKDCVSNQVVAQNKKMMLPGKWPASDVVIVHTIYGILSKSSVNTAAVVCVSTYSVGVRLSQCDERSRQRAQRGSFSPEMPAQNSTCVLYASNTYRSLMVKPQLRLNICTPMHAGTQNYTFTHTQRAHLSELVQLRSRLQSENKHREKFDLWKLFVPIHTRLKTTDKYA